MAQTPPFLLQRMCPAVLLPKERDRALEAMIYEQIFLLVPVEMRVPGKSSLTGAPALSASGKSLLHHRKRQNSNPY